MRLATGYVALDGMPHNMGGVAHTPEDVVLVFQECQRSLLPWLTARENVRWSTMRTRMGAREREEVVMSALHETGLERHQNYFPHQLSGGLRQRLALARVLAHGSKVLLMDEPFNSLDVYARYELEDVLRKIWQTRALTIVLVTHELEEAAYLAQRVVMLSKRPGTVREIVPLQRDDWSRASTEFDEIRRRLLDKVKVE